MDYVMNESTIEHVKEVSIKELPLVFKDDLKKIILYGSCARGTYTDDSDIDIAILTKSDRVKNKQFDSKLDDIASKIGLDTLTVVNYVCLPYDEYEEKKEWYPYFMSINKEGITLYEQ